MSGITGRDMARIMELEAEVKTLREFIDSDAHHEMSTTAGLLRLWGDPAFKSDATPEKLTELGDRLADACRRARAVLGVCPGCGGTRLKGSDPCPECVLPKSEESR